MICVRRVEEVIKNLLEDETLRLAIYGSCISGIIFCKIFNNLRSLLTYKWYRSCFIRVWNQFEDTSGKFIKLYKMSSLKFQMGHKN